MQQLFKRKFIGFICAALLPCLLSAQQQSIDTLRLNIPDAEAIFLKRILRFWPLNMTLMAAIGFSPVAITTGIGSETQKPLARVVIGGLVRPPF